MEYSTSSLFASLPPAAVVFDVGSLFAHLQLLTDKRDPRGVRYPLAIALSFVILAKLAGEDEPSGIAQWVRHRQDLLLAALPVTRRSVPHPTTYSRILGDAVSADQLQEVVSQFLLSVQESPAEVINLDGKTLCGTIPAGSTQGLHLLAAYLPQQGVVLMQTEVSASENEISAAPRLLKSLDLRGKIVTGDAMFTQRELAELIGEAGGAYLFRVKENQPGLLEEIQTLFDVEEGKTRLKPQANDFGKAKSEEKGHGRMERRELCVSSALHGYSQFPRLEQVIKMKRYREELSSGKVSEEVAYAVTSLTSKEASAGRLLELVRGHWAIENQLHYRRDRTLKEDGCRLKRGAAQRMAILNNLVIGLAIGQGFSYLPEARRRYNAFPQEALHLLLRC